MKKVLLTVAAAFLGVALSAQVKTTGLTATSTHLDSVKVSWNSNKLLTAPKAKLITFDFSDTTGLTFSKFWTQTDADWNGVYKASYDKGEKALKIDFDWTKDGAARTGNNYSAILNYDWSKQLTGAGSSSFNPFINSADSVEGVLLDLTSKTSRVLAISVKAVDLTDSTQIRFDLSDANGRQSNQISPKHTIKPSSAYSTITFKWNVSGQSNDWNQDCGEITDGWSDAFLGVKNGRTASDIPSVKALGLPVIGAGGSDLIPLDTTAICKWNIQFNDGAIASSGIDTKFTIYIQKLQIGSLTSEGTADEFVFGPVSAAPIVDIKVGQFGNVFTFEGTASLINVLGQTVATGTGSIDASSLAAGIYFIVIDGVAKEVIVK